MVHITRKYSWSSRSSSKFVVEPDADVLTTEDCATYTIRVSELQLFIVG